MDEEILTVIEETQSDSSVTVDEFLGDSSEETEILAEVVEVERPFLTTSFEEYSVTEGLLLMILLLAVVMICVKLVKGGFFWL